MASVSDNTPYTFVPHTEYLNSESPLSLREHQLTIRQQPERARACGFTDRGDRRPLDPPPVAQLHVTNRHTGTIYSDTLHNPYYMCYATLWHHEKDEEVVGREDENGRHLLNGTVVTSMARLKDNENVDGAFFVFCNLGVKIEGRFRLMLNLFEISGGAVHCRAKSLTEPFYVYGKSFPGMAESTPLCRCFAEQGVRLRVRNEPKLRRKVIKRKTEDHHDTKDPPFAQPSPGYDLNRSAKRLSNEQVRRTTYNGKETVRSVHVPPSSLLIQSPTYLATSPASELDHLPYSSLSMGDSPLPSPISTVGDRRSSIASHLSTGSSMDTWMGLHPPRINGLHRTDIPSNHPAPRISIDSLVTGAPLPTFHPNREITQQMPPYDRYPLPGIHDLSHDQPSAPNLPPPRLNSAFHPYTRSSDQGNRAQAWSTNSHAPHTPTKLTVLDGTHHSTSVKRNPSRTPTRVSVSPLRNPSYEYHYTPSVPPAATDHYHQYTPRGIYERLEERYEGIHHMQQQQQQQQRDGLMRSGRAQVPPSPHTWY
ncbi:hypothetical protein SpCBS45565_g01166 [Spizellomyces sp. 'palustris']|nr:hypothetical protein SpCBS45565_g01166 [Spizellomyces sp. 'palustris']